MFLLSRKDRLILGEIIGPFVFSVLLFTSLFFAGGEFLRIAEYLGSGVVPAATVTQLILMTLPGIVVLTFPMAMLLAALLGFGRLSNDSEIVALVAAGSSFARLVVPLGVFAFAVASVGVWFANSVVPAANRGREAIIDQAKENGGLRSKSAFTFPVTKEGRLALLVHVEGGFDLSQGLLRNVSIQIWDKGQMNGAVYADRAKWTPGTQRWELYDFWSATEPKGEQWSGALRGASGRSFEFGTPDDVAAQERPVKEISSVTLRERIRFFRQGGEANRAREAEVELAQRIMVPFASFIFALVGAPLAVGPQRQGKGVGFGLSILIIFGYWIALQMVSFLGKSGALPPGVALAIPNVVGFAAAVYLIRRVLR